MKNKTLLIGQYRGTSGWDVSTADYIRAISKTQDITIRPLYMSHEVGNTPPDLLEFEEKKHDNYDVLIQVCLPHLFTYDGRFKKNAGICFTESRHFDHTNWPAHMNLMDEIWVPTIIEQRNLVESGVTAPVKIVPIPVDIKKFEQSYKLWTFPGVLDDTFLFYFVGEFITRKGLDVLLKAFHTEFSPEENVDLVIKTNKGGLSPRDLAGKVGEFCESTKKSLRLYPNVETYKKEIIVVDRLSDERLNALHKSCHCFIMPTRGDSWSRPCIDALGFGNPVITTKCTGPSSYIKEEENGWLLSSEEVPICISDYPLPDIYTGRETWMEPSIMDLRDSMRRAYTLWKNDGSWWDDIRDSAAETPYKFSYEKVGKIVEDLLNE